MRKAIVFMLLFLLVAPTNAAIAAINAGGNENTNTAGERNYTYQKNISRKHTLQKSKTYGVSKGREKSWQKAQEQAKRIVQGKHVEITVSIWDVVSPVLAMLEKHGPDLFKNCKLITNPPALNQLLGVVQQDGVIDEIALQYYQAKEKINGKIKCPLCTRYARCCVIYGAIVGQALLDFQNDMIYLARRGYLRIERANKHRYIVKGLSLKDLQKAFLAEIVHVLKTHKGTFYLRGLDFFLNMRHPTVRLSQQGFYVYSDVGFVQYIMPYMCSIDNTKWFGDTIAGLDLHIRISKGWSYEQAISTLAQSRRFKNIASATQRQLSSLIEHGMTKQYVILLKDAYQAGEHSDFSFNPTEIPTIK